MAQETSHASRSSDRRRQLKAGLILFNNRHSTLPCSVRDISERGARLEAVAANVPDTFVLNIELDGFEAPCEVVWRKVNFVGVRFTGEVKRVAQRRVQVLRAVSPLEKPSLRKKPTV